MSAGTRYGALAQELHAAGWALGNLASLPHISVAGAVATATHGSGDRSQNLAAAVSGLVARRPPTARCAPSSAATTTSPGPSSRSAPSAIAVQVTLDIEPTYDVAQEVHEDLPWETALANLDDVTSSAGSVSLFTDWRGSSIQQVWRKTRVSGVVRAARGLLRLDAGHRPEAPAARHRPRAHDRAAGVARSVARAPAALPPRLHAEQRRRAADGVPRAAVRRRRRAGGRPRPVGPDRTAAAGQRDPHHRRRRPVALHRVRRRPRRHPLHLAPAGQRGRRPAADARGRPGPVRRPPALGQALRRRRPRARPSVPALGRLPRRSSPGPTRTASSATPSWTTARARRRRAARPQAGQLWYAAISHRPS